jgi:hypothetical protein
MIEGIFYIEAQGNNEKLVRKSLESLVDKLRKEEKIEVRRESFGEVVREDGNFSSMVEVELEFQDFLSYVMAAIHYGPSAIEISGPAELILSPDEFLEALGEIIRISKTLYQKYNVGFRFLNEGKAEVGLEEEEIEDLLDQGAIRAKIVVEGKEKSRKKAIDNFLKAISEDVFISKLKSKKVESETPFSGLIGIEAFMYEARTLVDIAIKHTPVLIEILEPEEIRLSMLNLQDIGVDLAGVFFDLAHAVARPTS